MGKNLTSHYYRRGELCGMKKKIYCTPDMCDTCPYDDCIGEIRKKPGRKALPAEVIKQHRKEYNRRYREEHREELRRKSRERYHEKKNS